MTARRFIAVWFGTVALLGLVGLPLADSLLLAWPGDPEVAWIGKSWARKVHLAGQLRSGGRILIVSGSSGLFSFDAELLELRLGRPVMNLSTHAGLGLRHLLADAREVARPGDLVLLALEDSHYRNRSDSLLPRLEEKALWTDSPGRLWELSWPMLLTELYGHPLEDFAQGWRRRDEAMAPKTGLDAPRQYSSAELSLRGDYRGRATYVDADFPAAKFPPIKAVNREAAGDLERFFAWCGQRGIKLQAVLPATLRAAPGETLERSEPVLRDFLAKSGVPLLHLAGGETVPRELMLDTMFHANTAGRRIVTELLARELGGPAPAPDAPWLLVASRHAVLGRELVLAKEGVAGCLFLSAQKLDSPLCITPEEVRAQMQGGRKFVFADPEISPLLGPAKLSSRVLAEKHPTLAEWAAAYPQHVFLFARGPASTGEITPPFAIWRTSSPCQAAIVGTGPWAGLRLEKASEKSAALALTETDPREQSFRFPLALSVRANLQEGAVVTVDHVPLVEEVPGGLHVAVIDPETGLLVRHAAFTGPALTEWELREVVPEP